MNMVRRDLPSRSDPRAGQSGPAPRPGQRPMPGAPATTANTSGRPAADPRGQRPKGDDLFLVMRQLTELLTKENAALKRHRADEVKALTERKEQLARLYQGHMNAVHRDPNSVKNLDSARRTALAQNAMRLGDLMQENASLLKANIQSINMFFKAVTNALRHRQEEKAAAYSRSGALNGYAVTKRSLAVSFNQTM